MGAGVGTARKFSLFGARQLSYVHDRHPLARWQKLADRENYVETFKCSHRWNCACLSNTLCPLRHGLNSHSNLVRAAQWLRNVTRREFFGHAFEGIRNELKGRAATRANKMLKYYEYFSFEEAVLVEETAKIIRFVTADYLLLPTCSFLII